MRKIFTLTIIAIFTLATIGAVNAGSGRDYISIVGSSTVYPFATVVAETFGTQRELMVSLHEVPDPAARGALEADGLRSSDGGTAWSGQLAGGLERVSRLEKTLAEAGADVAEVRIREPSLRSVFFQLTGEDIGA